MKTITFRQKMRERCRAAFCSFLLILLGAATARAGDTLLTMPFENVSGKAQYHWIGESFAVAMSDLLNTPGMTILSRDERNLFYERLGLRTTDLLTRAAMIRLAETAQAGLALIGEYDIGEDQNNVTIAITARLIEPRAGRLVGNKVFNFSGPLADLQSMQGQLAWNILRERDPAQPFTREKMVSRARSIPSRAFESFIKGILTTDEKLRENFLRRALQEYDSEAGAGHYAQALYELGLLLYQQRAFAEAAKTLGQVVKDDPHYLEAQFFYGLAAWHNGSLSEAAGAYEKLVAPLPLVEVFNNAGALLTARSDLLGAQPVLQRGVELSPHDLALRFNYGYALWKAKNFEQAIPQLRAVVKASNRDGEALYLLAKCLGATGKKSEAEQVDQEARRYLGNYARWEVNPDQIPHLIRLKSDFNRAAFYQLMRQRLPATQRPQRVEQAMLRARELLEAGSDQEALTALQDVVATDPTLAEAHLLRGRIFQRRSDIESAISALSAAVYWNPRLVAAHVSLGQIYLARGDRARALAHGKQALELDAQDREAIALMRRIESDR